MSQFVPFDKAVQVLGITKERLTELRESGRIRAFRDGASWKFREDELQKLAANPSLISPASVSDLALEVVDEPSDPSDSILVSDEEVGGEGSRPPSTIIGKVGIGKGDSDLELNLESDKDIADSDVRLASPTSDVLGSGVSGSHVLGAPDSEPLSPPPMPSGKFEDLDELEIDLETESSKILSASEANRLKTGNKGSELQLVESDVLQTQGSPGGGTDSVQDVGDDDLVLSEGGGSDITLSAGDSGINLVEPSDSGLALDDISLELGGSGVESLELGEAEEHLVLEEDPSDEAVTALKAEDDFSLTPLGDMAGEESDDSGSQVIALDSAGDMGEGIEAILGDAGVGAAILQPAEGLPGEAGPMVDIGGVGPTAGIPTVPDTTFSGWNVAGLVICVLMLSVGGMMMFDLLLSIWSWNEPCAVNSTLMDALKFF